MGSCCQGQGHGAKGERAKGPPEVVRGEEEARAECKCEWLPSQPVPDPGGRQVTALGRGGGQGGVGRRFLQNTACYGVRGSGSGCVGWWRGGAEGTKATGHQRACWRCSGWQLSVLATKEMRALAIRRQWECSLFIEPVEKERPLFSAKNMPGREHDTWNGPHLVVRHVSFLP